MINGKMTYEERKHIVTVIVAWFDLLDAMLRDLSSDSFVMIWISGAKRRVATEAAIEAQLAASAGVLFCRMSSVSFDERMQLLLKEFPGTEPPL